MIGMKGNGYIDARPILALGVRGRPAAGLFAVSRHAACWSASAPGQASRRSADVQAAQSVVLLRPGLHEAGDYGRRIADGLPADFDSSSLMVPPIVSTGAPGLRHGAAGGRAVGPDPPDPPDHGNGQIHGE
jgi:hypothetical protein